MAEVHAVLLPNYIDEFMWHERYGTVLLHSTQPYWTLCNNQYISTGFASVHVLINYLPLPTTTV